MPVLISRFLLLLHRLQNKIIDLEVAANTPSPTIDPSVRTILVGHSMGGIVAAETVLSIMQDKPITSASLSASDANTFMFPYIQAILAFDTPYLGIAPGVVAHGAEGHWNQASAAYNAYSTVAKKFGWSAGGASKGGAAATGAASSSAQKMLTGAGSGGAASAAAAAAAASSADVDVATAPAWQRWGKYAMFAGAAGAVAAGGAAAWLNRESLGEGWKWAGSHLEFVGCLARADELRQRLVGVVRLRDEVGLGFADVYTCLGQAVDGQSQWFSGTLGEQRTFCSLPAEHSDLRRFFVQSVNDKATAEVWAHMSMFKARDNPGYHHLIETARNLIVDWTQHAWYEDGEVVPVSETAENIEDSEMVEEADANEEFETNFESVPDDTQEAWRN